MESTGGFETVVTEGLRAFLARIDTAFLATASAAGQPYVQHRGGPRGFIRAIDEHTLGLVDFAGNRQYVSTGNLSENDRVCLFLLDYERAQRVKVWGRARVVPATPQWLAELGDPDYPGHPEQILLLTVESWDVNCRQHIPRKVNLADVAEHVRVLEARIAALEEENRRLREDRT
jgi:hypothetical protein